MKTGFSQTVEFDLKAFIDKKIRAPLSGALNWLVPKRCFACAVEIAPNSQPCCDACYATLPFQSECCQRCGQVFAANQDCCGRCLVILPFLTNAKSRVYAAIKGGRPPFALCGLS